MFRISGSKNPDLLSVYHKASKVFDEGFIFRKRKRRERLFRYLRRLSVAIITVSCLILLYFSVHFVNFKVMYRESLEGKTNIEKAIASADVNENQSAIYFSKLAQNNFDTSLNYLHQYQSNFLVRNLDYFQKQYSDLDYLISTANTLSRGVEEASMFKMNLSEILLAENISSEEKKVNQEKLLKFIYESAPELFGIRANIDLALNTFNSISYSGILRPFRTEIEEIGKKIEIAGFILDQQIPLSQILPQFFGYPEKTKYLVVFQDNRMMTANGGAIRAYGVLENEMGEIVNFNTYAAEKAIFDFKDVEKTSAKKMKEKASVETKLTKLFSDLSLSPDWPSAAEKIKMDYRKNTGDKSEFDGVLAINNEFMVDLLSLTGPIKIGETEYSSQNVLNLFGYENNKNAIGEIIKIAKEQMLDKNQTDIFTAINFLSTNLIKKNIVLNFTDFSFQEISEERAWANEVKKTDGDYLMVVDTNIGAGANDVAISKNIGYNIDQDVNGIFADLHINYANNSTDKSVNGTYKNYLRIYVPSGCELIMSKGFDADGVEILEDLDNNKSIFAGTVTIEPGKIANIRIYYKLSSKVQKMAQDGEYSLYAQKQSGVKNNKFTVDLKFANSIRLYNPTGFNANLVENNQIHWETDYLTDRLFNVNF